jgi:hypothetical protein
VQSGRQLSTFWNPKSRILIVYVDPAFGFPYRVDVATLLSTFRRNILQISILMKEAPCISKTPTRCKDPRTE